MTYNLSTSQSFISIAANSTPHAADWCHDSNTIAYGAARQVALWCPTQKRGIRATLKAHGDKVNVVRFVQRGWLLSGSCDCTVRVWKQTTEEEEERWECVQVLKDHAGAVNTIAIHDTTIATGAADGTVCIYSFDPTTTPNLTLQQTIKTAPLYPLAIALTSLPDTSLLLAVGGSSTSIKLYTRSGPDFSEQATLKGHEDWIRSLAFTRDSSSSNNNNNDILLASASQDRYVRLWRVTPVKTADDDEQSTEQTRAQTLEAALLTGVTTTSSRRSQVFCTMTGTKFSASFEALLLGHDDWVHSVSWRPRPSCDDDNASAAEPAAELVLLTASADTNLMTWSPDPDTGIWVSTARLGEIAARGSTTATGSSGGFWGGLWGPKGLEVGTWGRSGGWRIWNSKSTVTEEKEKGWEWEARAAVGGHVREVKAVAWEKSGAYLLSTSLDQTTRLYAPWTTTTKEGAGGKEATTTWHEFARPQIHGYDINTISMVDSWRFASGADEKVLRIFDASKAIVGLLERLSLKSKAEGVEDLPEAANVPLLGLSNKAMATNTATNDPNKAEAVVAAPGAGVGSVLDTLTTPPLEEHLQRHTLFPEMAKLYGHGYELISVAASPDGRYVASACKASTPEHAVIRIFDTRDWKEVAILPGHTLTVTRIVFSGSEGRWMLAVGRDRSWAVYERQTEEEGGAPYKLVRNRVKAHARIVWDVSVAPAPSPEDGREAEGLVFATGSRDKTVKIWRKYECTATIKLPEPVTALEFSSSTLDGSVILAVGLEDGRIYVFSGRQVVSEGEVEEWRVAGQVEHVHDAAITRVAWRPRTTGEGWMLASGSEDCSVRIYDVDFAKTA
ncbi:Elongator subunit elp2 [Saitoella coloradoensis]